MSSDLKNLRVEKIIAHQIFQRDENESKPPNLSKEFTKLDEGGLAMFQERVVAAIGDESHCLEMSIRDDDQASVYCICKEMLAGNDDQFKELSEALAYKLANSQNTRRIPGGIILIFAGVVGDKNLGFIGIIKAELHGGFSVIQEFDDLLMLEYISKLLLTPQQKLYKVAIFINDATSQNQPITPANFRVLVYDHNMTRSETSQAAQYFYDTFLGCTLSPSAKKLTSDFFDLTKEFINALVVSDEIMLDLHTSLYAYLKLNQTGIVDASEFAQMFLLPELRDNYKNFMMMKGFPTIATIKDISYLKYKLRQRNIRFTSEVKISVPSDNFDQLINVRGREDGRTIVAIQGWIERND